MEVALIACGVMVVAPTVCLVIVVVRLRASHMELATAKDDLESAIAPRDAARIRESQTAAANGKRILELEAEKSRLEKQVAACESARMKEMEARAAVVRQTEDRCRGECQAWKQAADMHGADAEDVDEWTADRLRRRGWAVDKGTP